MIGVRAFSLGTFDLTHNSTCECGVVAAGPLDRDGDGAVVMRDLYR